MTPKLCQYQLSGGPCSATITPSQDSYTGWKHTNMPDATHWATPYPHPDGDQSDQFLLCAECDKLPDDNPEHFTTSGHQYIAKGVVSV